MERKFLKLTNTAYKALEFFPESDPLKNRAKDRVLAIMENLTLIFGTSGWASLQKEKAKIQLTEDIDILLGYFWIGKCQGWLSAINCLILSNEYEKIKKEINQTPEFTQKLPGMNASLIPKESPSAEGQGPPSPSSFAEASEGKKATEGQGTQKAPESVLRDDTGVDEKSAPLYLITDRQNPPSHEVTARQRKILDFLRENEKAQVMDLQTILPDVTKRTIRRDLDELLQAGKIERLGEFNQVFYKIKQ